MNKSKSILFVALGLIGLIACDGNANNPASSDVGEGLSSSETVESSSLNEVSSSDVILSSDIASSEVSSSIISSSSASTDGLPELEKDSVWNVNGALNGLRGAAFRDALAPLIVKTGSKTCSYASLWDYFPISDAAPDGGIRAFYHDPNYSTTQGACNKEHVWPNSRGVGKEGPGADPHIIRPALTSENSTRGNNVFGQGEASTFDPASCGYAGARGECARICFYAATRYYQSHKLFLNNDTSYTKGSTYFMGLVKHLVKWNQDYPVNAAEIKRNNELQKLGFARNPFIDHPEYADYIWNANGLLSSSNPATGTGTTGGSSSKVGHALITSTSALESAKEVMLVADNSGTYFGMSDGPKNAATPWYIGGEAIDNPANHDCSSVKAIKLSVTKEANGYVFKNQGGETLHSYVSGTHYSIIYGTPEQEASSNSIYWNVSFASDGKVTMNSTATGVYMEYYSSSFCGYKQTGGSPLYFYTAATHSL